MPIEYKITDPTRTALQISQVQGSIFFEIDGNVVEIDIEEAEYLKNEILPQLIKAAKEVTS